MRNYYERPVRSGLFSTYNGAIARAKSSIRQVRIALVLVLCVRACVATELAAETTTTESIRQSPLDSNVPVTEAKCVVLLHGLARTARSMRPMARRLRSEGFVVENIGYPSRRYDIDALAETAVGAGFDRCGKHGPGPPNFVTHSLGGILVRYFMKQHPDTAIGRVVMLGPPNGGSEVVDRLKNVPGFRFINGVVGRRLGTGAEDIPAMLGRVQFELGVIAGSRSYNVLLSQFLPNPDDGKVSVASTKVIGMCDFRVLPVTHIFMMRNDAVIAETISFLRTGRFLRGLPNTRHCR